MDHGVVVYVLKNITLRTKKKLKLRPRKTEKIYTILIYEWERFEAIRVNDTKWIVSISCLDASKSQQDTSPLYDEIQAK